MRFERDVWYVGALPAELAGDFVARKIAEIPVLIFRTSSGEVSAILDTCPHRFAPLSRGKRVGDTVQCGYHGMRFDGEGRCVYNPQSDLISPNMHIPAFPVVEKYSLVWLWLGDPALADEALIPDLTDFQTRPGFRLGSHYLHADYRYDILVDNVLDLSHVPYVHEGSFSSGPGVEAKTSVSEEEDGSVKISQLRQNSPAPPRDKDLGDTVDELYTMTWHPGQVMGFEKRTAAAGQPMSQARRVLFGHIATPADAKSTHYFMFHTRFHALDDPAVDEQMSAYQRQIISSEDSPMLEAIDERMAGRDLLSMRPVVLPADTGALRVRRVMARRLAAEDERRAAAAETTADEDARAVA